MVLIAFCSKAGAYTLNWGLRNLVCDCADSIISTADKDIFLGRQKEPLALAMKQAVLPGFDRPLKSYRIPLPSVTSLNSL
jgi:hypothetical protein